MRYIENAEQCAKETEEYLQEFKEGIYPAYASFGFTLPEAILAWKLQVLVNLQCEGEDEEDKFT